ncbi:MAG TPA: hypothetical protein VEA69_06015 [Tepidisphaeraceae bacterium]|nr:hypothetical protein [Tepidisphaeraceae bacterium]
MSKPQKPYPSFPLTPHVRGGWSKKYKGQQLYIADRDPDAALATFHRLARKIDRGDRVKGEVAKDPAKATVYDVCNRYVFEREADVAAGTLSQGACDDYADAADEMVESFGAGTLADDLTPDDFTRLFRRLEGRLKAHAMGRMVQSCRTIWRHAYENEWIDRMPRFGSKFKKPPTAKKQGHGFTVDEARILIACSVRNVELEATLLLMLNGGYTARDCEALPRSALDFKLGVIRFPRPKMTRRNAVDRVMVMWPETAEALSEVIAGRGDAPLVFSAARSVRRSLSRIQHSLGWASAKVKARGPSWFRHLHRTIADELEKPNAAARLMGHRLHGLAEVYVDRVEHSRIQEITDHIRRKLWPAAASRERQAPPGTPPASAG